MKFTPDPGSSDVVSANAVFRLFNCHAAPMTMGIETTISSAARPRASERARNLIHQTK